MADKKDAGTTKTKTAKPKVANANAKPNALQAEVGLSSDLEAIVGKGPMARGQVTSKLWEYIKANKLQSKEDGRQIDPDKTLAKVLGNEKISMFKMTAAVSKHMK